MSRDKTENSLVNRRNKDFVSNNDITTIIDKLISVILDNGGKLFGGFVRDYIVPKFIIKSKEILKESQIPIYRNLINIVSSYLYCVDDTREERFKQIPNLFFNDIDIIVPNKEVMNNIVEAISKLDYNKIKYTIKHTDVEIVTGKDDNQFGYFFNKNNHLLKMYDKEGNNFTCFVDFITIDRDVYIPSVTEYGISENLGYGIEEKETRSAESGSVGASSDLKKVSDRTKIFPVWDFSINLLSYSNDYGLKTEKGLSIRTKGKHSDEFYVYSIREEEFTLDDILNHILDRKLIPLNPKEIRAYYYKHRTEKFYKRKYKFEDEELHDIYMDR